MDAVFDVPVHGAGQDHFFEVAAFLDQILERIAMRDARDVLFDDGPVIQDFREVMSGRADQLDSALKRLLVRLRADKRRQERMVDVDTV